MTHHEKEERNQCPGKRITNKALLKAIKAMHAMEHGQEGQDLIPDCLRPLMESLMRKDGDNEAQRE